MVEYRGEIITIMGRGFHWNGMLWPQWEMLTTVIDNRKAIEIQNN